MKLDNGIIALAQPTAEGEIVEQKLTESVESGYYRVTVYRGIAQIFVDNRFVASFRAPKIAHKVSLRRVMSHGDATTFTAIKNTDDIFYFEDDFQGDNERPSEEYWYKIYGDTKASFANGTMTLSGSGTYLLDATAEHPTLRWKMKVNGTEPGTFSSETKEMSIALRYRNEYNNVKIVYSHYKGFMGMGNSGTWSVVETVGGTSKTVATASKRLTLGSEYDFVLDVEKDALTFTCGGTELFSGVELGFSGNGKFGFCPVSVDSLTVDEFYYEGNGKVNSGVNYSWWTTDKINGTTEFIKGDEENEVIMYYGGTRMGYSTYDGGATWGDAVDYTGYGVSTNTIYLQSGRRLEVSDWGNQSHANLFEADGTLVKSNSVLQHTDDLVAGRHAMSGRLMQSRKVWGTASAPRVFYVTSEGSEVVGTTRVYYSDDEGITWTESTTVLDYENMGNFYGGEADIVDLPDGTIRVWLRSDRGFLHYVDSRDGGVTFGITPIASHFLTPSTAFSIERDSESEQTYYLIWEYDVTNASLMYIQQPRNRTAMAVSYDGCETWEYIMEMDDQGTTPTTDHMNSNVRVIDGIVYVNHSYLYAKKYSDTETVKTLVYAIDPSKINTTKRFANAHIVKPDFTTVYNEVPSQAVIPKTTGNALIFGEEVPIRIDENGMVEAEVMAKALGAELIQNQNGVTLSIGDGEVVFEKGSAVCNVNGAEFENKSVCLSEDGEFLNPEVCAEIFGKKYTETASSYLVLSDMLHKGYRDELENLSCGMSDELKLCIEDFKAIGSAQEMKKLFEEYKVLLNLCVDFTDKSYENMYGVYMGLDLSLICDYKSMTEALDLIISAEKGRVNEFIEAVNVASSSGDWAAIRTYMTDTYADVLSFVADTSDVNNDEAIFRKMLGITYNSVEEIESVFMAAYTAQIYAERDLGNAITVSTASQGFKSWTPIAGNDFGGVTSEYTGGKNLVTLSAYEGMNGRHEEMLSDIEAENGAFVIQDNIFYSADGADGQTMSDLLAIDKDVFANDVTVDENGELVLSKTAADGNSVMAFTQANGMLKQGFDGAVIDLTLCCDPNARLFLYFNDNSAFRYASMYFQPNSFNNSATNSNLVWTEGQYYDMKLVTAVMGYDESGQARTYANLYVKKSEDETWICAVKDKPMTLGAKLAMPQITFMGTLNDKDIRFRKVSIKTYTRDAGDYEYINSAVTMPEIDYVYSFDYMRMDADTPTMFTIGGEDYGQSFAIEPYRITSNLTDAVRADIDFEEDKWYRIFGTVNMTAESTHINNNSKVLKNTITMYVENEDGDVTLLFENLPMLKEDGRNGLRFGMTETYDAGIRLKNIRVYNGKALDVYSAKMESGSDIITVELLNDDEKFSNGQLFAETKSGSDKSFVMKADSLSAMPFETVSIDIDNVGEENKFYLWSDLRPVIPAYVFTLQN